MGVHYNLLTAHKIGRRAQKICNAKIEKFLEQWTIKDFKIVSQILVDVMLDEFRKFEDKKMTIQLGRIRITAYRIKHRKSAITGDPIQVAIKVRVTRPLMEEMNPHIYNIKKKNCLNSK